MLMGEKAVTVGALAPHTLKAGEYLTQLTVEELGTIVEASVNTSFSVVATRLRVTFVDGTEREVDKDSNVTLRVEVASPSPNYTLHWDCFPQGFPGATCFQQPDILNTFPTTTNVGENFFSRLQHLWELLHNNNSINDNNNNMNIEEKENLYDFLHSSPPPPVEEEDHEFEQHFFNNNHTYIVSLTFPASILLTAHTRFHFSVSVTRSYQLLPVNASQLVVVMPSKDNIGIQTCLGSQFPFGAQRRMVFESECMSCSPEELEELQYTWRLNMIVNEQTFAEQRKDPDEKEVALERALRRGRIEEFFLPRPRDYLRVHNISLLQEALIHAASEEDVDTAPASPTLRLSPRDLQNMPGVVTPEIMAQAAEIYRQGGGLRHSSRDARGSLHRSPTTRMKRDLEQSDPALIPKVKKSSPSWPVGDSGVMDGLLSNGQEGGEAWVSATAPAAARHAQRRQMREDDRTSSSQTNMRRKVVGRHSGEAAQGPVTDEAALPARGSPTAPALVKVTFGSHQSHLAHRTTHNPRQRAKDGEGGSPATHPPTAHDPPLRLPERNTVSVETEHQTEPTEIPDHRRITKRNSRAEKMIETYEMAFAAPWIASAQGVGHGGSRNSGVKWEAMGKVVDVEEATQQHQVIPSKGKVQENEYLKIMEEEKEKDLKEKEDEKRLWQVNDVDHAVRYHPLGGGSGRGEERRPVTEAAPRTGGVSTDVHEGLMEDERHSTVTPLPDTPAAVREAATAQKKVTAGPLPKGITRESAQLQHAISTADDASTAPTLKPATRKPNLPNEAEEARERHGPGWQHRQHPHGPGAVPSPLPPLLPPRSPSISITLRTDNKEGDQFSSDPNHAARRSEGPETSALPQQLRGSRGKDPGGGAPPTEIAERLRQRADQQRFRGKVKKQRKKEKLKSTKTERRKGGSDKGRQEVRGRGGGDATPRHPWEQEVGYKENDLTSRVSVKVAEDEANDAQEAQHDVGGAGEARQVARTSRLLAHQHSDSAHTPVSPTPRTLSERGGAAAVNPEPPAGEGLPWYEREGKPAAVRGVGGKVRASEPRHSLPGATRPTQTHPWPGMFSSSAPLDSQSIPTDPPRGPESTSRVPDYHEYMKLKMAELGHRKIDSHGTFGPDRSTGNPARKPDGQGKEGESAPHGLHPRLADGKAPNHTTEDGMDQAASASQRRRARLGPTDHVEEERHDSLTLAPPASPPLFPGSSSSSNGPPAVPWYKMQGRNVVEAAGGDGSDSTGRGQGEVDPQGVAPPPPPPPEGRSSPSRGPGYIKDMAEFVRRTGSLPDLGCRAHRWEECAAASPGAERVTETLRNTLGDASNDSTIMRSDNSEEIFVTEESQVSVILFGQLTSTGTHNPVLVLYMDLLSTNQNYILYLNTYNPITNNTGRAKQLIKFSPAPTLENCQVIPLSKTKRSYFRASCSDVKGHFYPVVLQWSYHFLWLGAKTIFYHGARTSFDFTLPPGLEAYDYKVYISVKAIDGKGVSFRYSDLPPIKVVPRSDSGDGVLSIFQEISTIENESPPLLLQQVRSLAWELNILRPSAITQTVVDNILTILFYSTSCKDMLGVPTGSPVSSHTSSSDYFVKINFLKSCARDHLAEKVVSNPMRDELEVIQALTALQIIIDANENISSTTYLRVLSAMNIAAERMWFSYFAQVRTEAAEEYFILSSAMLDKQTEMYDWNSTSIDLITNIITQLLDIMEIETSARFREEKPLVWYTDTLTFYGYWAESLNINKWNNTVPFLFESGSVFFGVTLVQALVHTVSPFNLPVDPITSEVVYLAIYMPSYINRKVEVTLRHSVKRSGIDFDFRRDGVLSPESLSVYEFEVQCDQQPLVFNVLLEVTRVLNSQYPVAAVVLICEDLQSLYEPLYKQELMATAEPSDVLLTVPTNGLPTGKMLLIIIDKNSYDNNWGRYNTSSTVIGADFKVSAWWSRCMVWNSSTWDDEPCSVVSESSSWDRTVCSCDSKHSVYGAQTIPVLDEESKIDVNELMLHETYIALYFIILLLVFYFLLALAVQTSDRHRLRRRNIWLRDNKLEHEWAYLLTIKTGTQWNAGTTSKVYAILHGTHGMSETRELQSKQTGQLFTRGALCTFILTTPEPLGDILKVQVWHDNSGGSESGWFVCETSVADLVLGAIYIYPCYRWLSVQAEDAKIEREITLESPTTFLQDFEHFLPQYASEHMLWTSLLTTSNTAKLYRLQRLTICLIVCLCLGTVSLWVVKKINNKHTMMVPDMHIEPLYYGVIIAMVLLPVQWVLEMIFKMSNKLEEKEYNAKAVLDTLRVTKSDASANTDDTQSSNDPPDSEANIYDPEAEIWKNLRKWGLSTELSQNVSHMLHPTLVQDLETDNVEIIQRLRSSTGNVSRMFQSDGEFTAIQPESPQPDTSVETDPEAAETSEESNKICSTSFLGALPKLLKPIGLQCLSTNNAKNKPCAQEENWEAGDDEDYEDDEDAESDDLRVSSSITFIFSQCVGWIMCCIFVAMCCMVLYIYGSGMPMDYSALWIHIIYVTLCCSIFVMQPLVVVIYTFYKVCVYRWLGCRGCISSCITVPLDQVVDIWNRYQTALRRQTLTTPDNNTEKLLEERQRTRELRSAHPPSEDYLLKCREKEIRREKVYSLFRNTLGHLALLMVLIILANNVNIYKRFSLNEAISSSLKNGSCLDTARYRDPCTLAQGDYCNQIPNENYMTFEDIKTKDDWWQWAYTELIALTYSNHDESFSDYNIFCDTNSIIIGQPRLRKYDSTSQECEASKVKIDSNRSMADLLKIGNCFPDYVDEVPHLFSFGSNMDKEYEWDAHFLAVTHGQYSQYSYTSYKQDLPSSKYSADLMFYLLQTNNWMNNNGTRAVVTEFTLYHPQTNLYTTLNLLAEFPSLSGAEMTVFISSSPIERYERRLAVIYMLNEAILLGIAMYYLKLIAVYIYNCRFRIWKSYWGMLDVLMTVFSWSYIVCLMLRVQIAEDAMWQLRVAYFQKFVNLKGLTTWDGVLETLIGCMLTVHLLRCLSLVKYLPRSYRLGLVLASAWKDVKIISRYLLVFLIAFMCLGHTWFNTRLWEFHSHPETLLTLLKMVLMQLPFLRVIEEEATGSVSVLGYLYYLLTYVFLYQLMRALYVAAFLNARKTFVDKPGLDVKWKDITFYMKERYQSLLGKICQKEKEEESQPADNTPPDFYMAELELQINQVMSGLESLAESLGVVVDRMNRLEDTQSCYSDTIDSEEHLWRDNDGLCSNDETWQEEDSESRTSTFLNERETTWDSMQQQLDVGESDFRFETNCTQGARPRFVNEAVNERKMSVNKEINLDAFTDIESCQTGIEALTQKWNSALGDPSFELLDDGGTLEKFLKDVSESFDNFTSFGKYGKTQLRVNTRIHPSHESLNLSQNNSGVTENVTHQKGIHSDSADGSVPRGISSRLCKTQTQGRGKGQVDALDISILESDHEDESNC